MAIHATAGLPMGKDPMADPVFRGQIAAKNRVDPTGTYFEEVVTVSSGPRDARKPEKIKLKVAFDEPFVFAVYKENPTFHDRDELEWDAAARNALEKFVAAGGHQLKNGPLHEHGARYNYFIELLRPVKWQPDTLARLKDQREAREAAQADLDRANELRRLLGANEGMRI